MKRGRGTPQRAFPTYLIETVGNGPRAVPLDLMLRIINRLCSIKYR